MKVTPHMALKWTKAVFLVLIGIVLLVYGGGVVEDFETNATEEWNMSFEWTWDLLGYLIWILIAWLFVYAALTVALSFKMDLVTLGDVMRRLDRIESKLERAQDLEKQEDGPADEVQEEPVEHGVPPPPGE